ncbi:aminoglycoside 6-adenylyltransferase [Litoreibacter roseus]|uniref:Nucleotidyltransferase domain-containing protein n=1 Tax=Litoreibacter roseus TaxID=2601869 RepID=A0A6N6JKR9_9RHOB|nr:aminoglycoside 6-adenylyltransferase [Litoreibacter roseus]GFE66019.1 hypothetical protein KIN_30930 [Litoreibacter roseus]
MIIGNVTAKLSNVPSLQALFMAGSHGKGTADAYSDLDFVAVADTENANALTGSFKNALEDLQPVIYWSARHGITSLANAVLHDWVRCDLFITSSDKLTHRAQDSVTPLFDPSRIYETLPATLPEATPNPQRINYIINEFIRVLGLTHVGLGRGELVMLTKGCAILRDLTCDLLLETCTLPDRGGVLHLKRLLTPDQMAILEALPYPGPNRTELIDAVVETSRVFFPLARDMAERAQIDWPEAFQAATLRHLSDNQNITISPR